MANCFSSDSWRTQEGEEKLWLKKKKKGKEKNRGEAADYGVHLGRWSPYYSLAAARLREYKSYSQVSY